MIIKGIKLKRARKLDQNIENFKKIVQEKCPNTLKIDKDKES